MHAPLVVLLVAAVSPAALDTNSGYPINLGLEGNQVLSGVLTIDVQPGQVLAPRVIGRVSNLAYRVQVVDPAGGTQTFDLPAQATPSLSNAGSPACRTAQELIRKATSAQDEAQAGTALREMYLSEARKECPALDATMTAVGQASMFVLPRTYVLVPGQKMTVTVSRLAAGGVAAKTWPFVLSPAVSRAQTRWIFRSEGEWLVAEVARDVAEMMSMAATGAVPDDKAMAFTVESGPPNAGGQPSYRVSAHVGAGPAVTQTIQVGSHVWHPATYASWAAGVQHAVALVASKGARQQASALAALVDPRPATIQRENERISAWLVKDPRDPSAHEQAALLVGTLALREAAGDFADTRRALCRLSAHLTVASALRGGAPASREGRYAAALLETLAGRQLEALAALDREARAPRLEDAERAWITALRMRNDGDYRALAAPVKATLLERREYFRALKVMQGGLKAVEAMRDLHPEPIADWGRIVMEGEASMDGTRHQGSVEEGNMFARGSVTVELQELTQVWPLKLDNGSVAAVVQRLQPSPQRGVARDRDGRPSFQVIDDGTWAAYFQRHLLSAFQRTAHHYEEMQGLPEEAAAFRSRVAEDFGGLALFPLLDRSWQPLRARPAAPGTTRKPRDSRCTAELGIIADRPENVTALAWMAVERYCFQARTEKTLVPLDSWFVPGVPAGTTYDAGARLPYVLHLERSSIERTHALAPFDPVLVRAFALQKYGQNPPPDQFKEAWGPLLAYNAEAAVRAARLAPPGSPQAAADAVKLCQADADRCLPFGSELFNRGQDDDGARALERGLKEGRDRVAASGYMNPLVDYYFDRNQPARAMEIADAVAEVNSQAGLRTKARLLFRMERYAESEKWYRMLAERYPEEDWNLRVFYVRAEHRHPGGPYKAQAQEALTQMFSPQGLVKVTVEDYVARKQDDRRFVLAETVLEPGVASLGLRPGDHILAVDGLRVSARAQYFCVKGFTDDPDMSVIVWRNGEFQELKGKVRRTYFGPPHPPARVGTGR